VPVAAPLSPKRRCLCSKGLRVSGQRLLLSAYDGGNGTISVSGYSQQDSCNYSTTLTAADLSKVGLKPESVSSASSEVEVAAACVHIFGSLRLAGGALEVAETAF
jgi:hypothetical protein